MAASVAFGAIVRPRNCRGASFAFAGGLRGSHESVPAHTTVQIIVCARNWVLSESTFFARRSIQRSTVENSRLHGRHSVDELPHLCVRVPREKRVDRARRNRGEQAHRFLLAIATLERMRV